MFHLHFHVMPRFEGEALETARPAGMEEPAVLKAHAEKIKAALGRKPQRWAALSPSPTQYFLHGRVVHAKHGSAMMHSIVPR